MLFFAMDLLRISHILKMMALSYLSSLMRYTPRKNWIFSRETAVLSEIREKISLFLKENSVPSALNSKIILCVDEAAANIVEHACATPPNQEPDSFIVRVTKLPNSVRVTLSYEGDPFDPNTVKKEVDMADHVRQGKRNGLGLFIMRKLLKIFEYRHRSGRNFCILGTKI